MNLKDKAAYIRTAAINAFKKYSTPARTCLKMMIVKAALWHLLAWDKATWMIQTWGLSDA